jgi:hypothetical protein
MVIGGIVIRSLFDFDKVDQPSIQMSDPVRTFNCRLFDHIQTPLYQDLDQAAHRSVYLQRK